MAKEEEDSKPAKLMQVTRTLSNPAPSSHTWALSLTSTVLTRFLPSLRTDESPQKGSVTTVSRSDIRLIQYLDLAVNRR